MYSNIPSFRLLVCVNMEDRVVTRKKRGRPNRGGGRFNRGSSKSSRGRGGRRDDGRDDKQQYGDRRKDERDDRYGYFSSKNLFMCSTCYYLMHVDCNIKFFTSIKGSVPQ